MAENFALALPSKDSLVRVKRLPNGSLTLTVAQNVVEGFQVGTTIPPEHVALLRQYLDATEGSND